METTVLFHIHIGDLFVRVWLGIVDNLAVEILFSTSFNYRFIRKKSAAKLKVVLWHSYPMTTHALTPRGEQNNSIVLSVLMPSNYTSWNPSNTGTNQIREARQTYLKLHSKRRILVTTTASNMNEFEPRLFKETFQNNIRCLRRSRCTAIPLVSNPDT